MGIKEGCGVCVFLCYVIGLLLSDCNEQFRLVMFT
jgi:hypothetical protein